MNLPKVSIIFTNYNGGQNPIHCVNSIKKLNYPQKLLETIVVDNHSTDGSTQEIKRLFPKTTLLYQEKNLGFAGAINLGVKKAKGDYVFITNDDITFEKNSLKSLVRFALEKGPCIAGGKQVHPQTKKFVAGGRKFSFYTGMQTHLPAGFQAECDQIDGCTMLMRANLARKLGPYDESFYPVYSEDLDLCIRAKKMKIPVIYFPDAVFFHKPSQSVSKLPKFNVYYFGFKNRLRLMIKHATPVQLLCFFVFHYFLTIPGRIFMKREPIFLPELKAIAWNIKNLKKTLESRA